MSRQIILDTETTGLDPKSGHRLIELGCIELEARRPTGKSLHMYFNPDREVPQEAINVHGITNEFLQDKPRFFEAVDEVMQFLQGAELVIHNAPFDLGFLNHELNLLRRNDWGNIEAHCEILDTLLMARERHPGQRNSLDALCKRYDIDNSHRTFHGALLDSQILMDVYLRMTGGQTLLFVEEENAKDDRANNTARSIQKIKHQAFNIPVVQASEEELAAHKVYCKMLSETSGEEVKWT